MVNSAKNAAVGRHPLSHFLSTDPRQLKFSEIEEEIRTDVRKTARENYGIEVDFLGIKKLGLPESITQRVFDRMAAERQKHVQSIRGDGERQAIQIRSAAELEQQNILAEAERQATSIRGQADAEAAKSFAVFEQEPRLAILLLKLTALEQTLKERTTLILDDRTPPLDLLRGVGESAARGGK
jgi:membrane protease subunit HflC